MSKPAQTERLFSWFHDETLLFEKLNTFAFIFWIESTRDRMKPIAECVSCNRGKALHR
jgi:hypothetical protein